MDIANRVGVKAHERGPKGTRFVVAIAGLTDNPTYGLCAARDVTLTASATEISGQVPTEFSYQWYSMPGGAIAGATDSAFTPSAALADLSEIYCMITVPSGSRSSSPVILREAPPQVLGSLADAVFDLDTGPQIVPTAAAFAGESLSFAVSGAGASIDAQTGAVSIPTDAEILGAVVTVTAANSGGAEALAFQVTVENLVSVEGAMPFGALTPAGVGGVDVAGSTITAGDPGGHWQISGGRLVPTAAGAGALSGIYPLEFDNGDTLDVMIEEDKASARPEEIEAVFSGLPLTARGLLVQNGDPLTSRIRLEPKVFASEMVMEPANWLEDPQDLRQSVRPVILSGVTIGGDPSNAEVLRMENLTVQGFVCHLEQGPGEPEFNNGIILVERPSRHVTIRQNEVWSRDLAEIIAADDFRDNLTTSRQMRGITTKVYDGTNEHIRIEENWVHDVSRGMGMVATNSYQGQRSRLCGNIIEDCYTNFFTCGFLNGLDIFDNRCMGVYAANGDTLGPIPASSPHSAAGGSFDTAGSRITQNITLMGNFFHTGWKRTKIHADQGLPVPAIGATGIKFNDPQAADAYWNLIVAFNTVVSHGICLEISGAGAESHTDVFNNTLISESYAGVGSSPVVAFNGAQNVRLFNNIAPAYVLGSEDGNGTLAQTLDTLEGYGNLYNRSGETADFGERDYFVGHEVKGLALLSLDEALLAYVPEANTRAMTAAQKKGATGTGLYAGNGVHGVVYDKPVSPGGTPGSYPLTVWDGAAYMRRTSQLQNLGSGQGITFAIQAESDVVMDGLNAILFSLAGQRLYVRKSGGGNVSMKVENNNATFMAGYPDSSALASDKGLVNFAFSADFDQGVLIFAINGELSDWYVMSDLARATLNLGAANPRIFANEATIPADIWAGKLGLLYLTDTFIDLETSAGLGSLFAQNGQFRDFGPDGAVPTGTQPLIFVKGTAAEIGAGMNLGRAGTFELMGTIADDGTQSDTEAPTITALAPAAGETNVVINIKPAITFSEAIQFGSGLITLYDVDADTVLETFDVTTDQGSGAGQVEIVGDVLTVFPTAPLGHETTYAVQIAAAAVEDLAGNAFGGVTDTTTIRFVTVPGVAGYSPTSVSLVSYTGSLTETVTIPGGIQAGDIILLEGLGIESTSTGTFGSRAGFVSVGQTGAGGQRKAHFMAKVADGTEQGTVTPVGDSGNGNGSSAIVLRLDSPATSLSFLNADIGIGLGSPNPKGVPSGTYTTPVLVFAFYHVLAKNSDIGARNFTGMTADFEQHLLVDAADDLWCKVRLLKEGDTLADIAASTDSDHGGYNMVGIGAIQLA